jgi:cytochrome c biogenesis protein CcdA
MEDWIQEILKGDQFGLLAFVAAFLFGISSAVTTAACGGIPAMLVIIGYTGASKGGGRRKLLMAAAAFTISSVGALMLLGALMSYFGGSLQDLTGRFGFYGLKAIGLVAIFIGFLALDFLPFRLPEFNFAPKKVPSGMLGASIIGLTAGVASAGCAATCSPLQLPVVLGLATLRGEVLQGAFILGLFALGYTFPMVAVMLGVGLGKTTKIMEKIETPLRLISGLFLIGVGFYLLAQMTLSVKIN